MINKEFIQKPTEIVKTIPGYRQKTKPLYPKNPILIIDDEPAIANLFQMKLKKFGMTNIDVRELKSMTFDAISRHKSHILSMDTFKSHINRHNKSNQMQNQKMNTLQTVFKTLSDLPTSLRKKN